MKYLIKLTAPEVETLGWAANRGYFPKETFDAMGLDEKSVEIIENAETLSEVNDFEATYEIPEHAAWAITMQRENDPNSLYAGIGFGLLAKLINLENSIV